MRASILSLLVLAVSPPLVHTQTKDFKVTTEVTVAVGDEVMYVFPLVDADEVKVGTLSAGEFTTLREFTDTKTYSYEIKGKKAGTGYMIMAGTKAGKLQELVVVRVVVKAAGPGPTPVPPTPVPPDPTPPAPIPPKPDAPIAGPGFKVLIVYEAMQATTLTEGQQAALFGKETRAYLDSHTAADGAGRAYRIWDQNTNTAGAGQEWIDATKRPRASVPWIVISDGKTGFEGPLPKTLTEITALLKKYGGQ